MNAAKSALFLATGATIATVLGLAGLEGMLRLTRPSGRYYPYHPNAVKVFYPSPELTEGLGSRSGWS